MEKELFKFKITLFLLPIIPSAILWYKNHLQIAVAVISVCWGILLGLLLFNLFRFNIDKPVYLFIKKLLKYMGIVLSAVALVFSWLFTVLPTGIISLLFKRDRLNLKKTCKATYWKDFKETEPSYENQY